MLSQRSRSRIRRLLDTGPTYLLRDEFTTARAAGAVTLTAAEPGPGTRTVVDTGSVLDLSAGALRIGGRTGWLDPGLYYASPVTWSGGRAALIRMIVSANAGTYAAGFHNAATDMGNGNLYWNNAGVSSYVGPSVLNFGSLTPGTEVWGAVVQRPTAGRFIVAKHPSSGDWYLGWVYDAGVLANPRLQISAAVAPTATDPCVAAIRLVNLGNPWDTDYSLATERHAGTVSLGADFPHNADALIQFDATKVPSTDEIRVAFRLQDDSNKWAVAIDSAGTLTLREYVAGSPTTRGTSAGVVSNGDPVIISATGNTIRVASANIMRITYYSAANFQTQTAGILEALGDAGEVSDLITWPRILDAAAAAELERYIT